MPKICLFADDGKTAENLISKVVNISQIQDYVGIALYPEALSVFEEYGLKSINLDEYITRHEHEENGIEASNFIFHLNEKLGLNPQSGHSFHFKNFDLLHSLHWLNYLIFGQIFYLFTTILKVLKDVRTTQVFAVNLKTSLKSPLESRPRSLFSEALTNICESREIPITFIPYDNENSVDLITGLDTSYYLYRNSTIFFKLSKLFTPRFALSPITEKISGLLPKRQDLSYRRDKTAQSILYLGHLRYYYDIIKQFKLDSVHHICLDYSNWRTGYRHKWNNLTLLNIRYLLDNFLSEENKGSISEYNTMAQSAFKTIVQNSDIRNNFFYRDTCFYNIFLRYLRAFVSKSFLDNLKIYNAMKSFANTFNVKFALSYCGWTLPETFSIHEALKKNNVHTAYFSHGLNVVNKEIARIIRGDGSLLPCDILFAPGSEFLRGHVKNGLKDKDNNFVTGFPFYKKAKRIEVPYKKFILKKILGLNTEKKIILYPLTKGCPHLSRPNMCTYSEEYNFVRKLAKVFHINNKFQLVIKSKHDTVPDQNYLKLFHDNYPNVVMRYGSLLNFLSITDVVINFNSSSGIDALLADIPVIYFKPHDRCDWFDPYASGNSEPNFFFKAENYEDILRLCNTITNGEFPQWYHGKMMDVPNTFLVAEGKEAAENIAMVIRENLQ